MASTKKKSKPKKQKPKKTKSAKKKSTARSRTEKHLVHHADGSLWAKGQTRDGVFFGSVSGHRAATTT